MSSKISVIVPVFEQWHLVPRLLQCLENQSYPEEFFEVLLIDNGSKEILYPDYLRSNVRVFRCSVPGAYAARNYGIAQSVGDWLIFTDADCMPEPDWLSEILEKANQQARENIFVAGRVEATFVSEEPSSYEIYDVVRGIPQEHYVNRGYAATANLAIPRPLMEKLQGFDARRYSGGDAEFCRRARSAGYTIVYAESAVVKHQARTCWDSIATKARRVKGGQLVAKSTWFRCWIIFRTLISPLISIYRLGGASKFSIKYRVISILVYVRLWGVEMLEVARFMLGNELERR